MVINAHGSFQQVRGKPCQGVRQRPQVQVKANREAIGRPNPGLIFSQHFHSLTGDPKGSGAFACAAHAGQSYGPVAVHQDRGVEHQPAARPVHFHQRQQPQVRVKTDVAF